MKLRYELAKTNRELLEAATSFKFHDYKIEVIEVPGSSWVVLRRGWKTYDRLTGEFMDVVNELGTNDKGEIVKVEYKFTDVYDAYEVMKELIK